MQLTDAVIRAAVEAALREDIGHGDVTTNSVIPTGCGAIARMVFKEDGIVAGSAIVTAVFHAIDPGLNINVLQPDGSTARAGTTVVEISGEARAILTGERVALNFVQRLSGIATQTARYVAAVGELPTRILDTRKTTPGLRALEKYAVTVGGGVNHRFGLYDAIMLKDNHLAIMAKLGVPLEEVVQRARAAVGPLVSIEVEVESVAQAAQIAGSGVDMILLDNMPPDQMREAVAVIAGRAKVEASGGITLESICAVAESGVNYISVGALTHSARALDISLDIDVGVG
jgi:nicotinate-nucleotide pyrophosphorylase (carboxylating)